jgi:Na+:H+ antiporter, NhaA family
MSLFIATLAFQGTSLLDSSKIGILAGSLVAGVVGAIVLRIGLHSDRQSAMN